MNVLHRIRRNSGTLARVNTALFVLVWLSIVVAPCAMAMQAGMSEPERTCPYCPPKPCAELAPEDCEEPDSLDSLPIVEKADAIALLPPRAPEPEIRISMARIQPALFSLPPARAGPRPHLVHAKFNE